MQVDTLVKGYFPHLIINDDLPWLMHYNSLFSRLNEKKKFHYCIEVLCNKKILLEVYIFFKEGGEICSCNTTYLPTYKTHPIFSNNLKKYICCAFYLKKKIN